VGVKLGKPVGSGLGLSVGEYVALVGRMLGLDVGLYLVKLGDSVATMFSANASSDAVTQPHVLTSTTAQFEI
jgi:hypothetical protein